MASGCLKTLCVFGGVPWHEISWNHCKNVKARAVGRARCGVWREGWLAGRTGRA